MMFWKKSKDKEGTSSKGKSTTTTVANYSVDGALSSSGSAVMSYESKMKSSATSTSSKTKITVTSKQTVSQKSNFKQVTTTYTPMYTLSNTSLSQLPAARSILERQKTEPSITRRQDAIGYNPKYISPYRTGNLTISPSPLLPTTKTKTTTKSSITYTSPYAAANPTRAGASGGTPIAVSTTSIWNPMSSIEPKKLPAASWNYPAKSSYTPEDKVFSPPPTVVRKTAISKQKLSPGVVFIFHNDKFDNPNKEFRVGSAEDVQLLKKTFQALKMSVTVHENLTVREVDRVIQKIQTKDFSKASCIVIVILSHGTRYETVAAKDDSYSVDDNVLFPILRNRSLQSKPKLLFIQACKGDMEVGKFHKDAMPPTSAPEEILKCYSTFEGYVAYRTEKGSPFIQELCDLLQNQGKSKNIKDIMDEVIKRVKDRTQRKQIPSYETTLTEPYCFGDYV